MSLKYSTNSRQLIEKKGFTKKGLEQGRIFEIQYNQVDQDATSIRRRILKDRSGRVIAWADVAAIMCVRVSTQNARVIVRVCTSYREDAVGVAFRGRGARSLRWGWLIDRTLSPVF